MTQINEALGALGLLLSEEEIARLEEVAGARYDKHSMAHLDSEK